MDISELKQNLLDNKIIPFYVFTGEELALQDIYIDKIAEITGFEKVRAETLASIYPRLKHKTLIKEDPRIFIIRNDDEYKRAGEKNWDKFLQAKSLKGNIVIMLYSDVEKSSKFAKYHDEVLTQFDYVGDSLLKNRLQAVTNMPMPYCEDIVKMCANNYGRIKNELYKLGAFARINKYSWNTAYLEAKKNNMIHEEIGDVIFDYTNAVIERKIHKAYEMYDKVKQTEDGTLRLITVLYNSFRQILMIQSTPQNMRTEEILGLTKGQIYVTSQKCNYYNLPELVHIVKTLRYLEKGIKIGTIAEEYAMPYLMGTIW